MPKLRPDDVPLTQEENAAVMAGIAADPDTFEADDEWFNRARPATEVEPESSVGVRVAPAPTRNRPGLSVY